MHPFSLKQETTKEVTGGALQPVTIGCTEAGGGIIPPNFPPTETTMALGEEGGFPIDRTF
ncbi:hypothetical protein [Aliiglaciecola litoralis]|uniref:Lasso RiPP family leader peptide-containing protein n=1 Tax=Aliiglaciecola litoralis TaxID=582857 RepID=A0ABP3WQ76_9ALTE